MNHWLLGVLREDVGAFEELLESGDVDEWTDIEFKESFDNWETNVAKAVSGFANTDGGLLVFGVRAKQRGNERLVQPSPVDEIHRRVRLLRAQLSRAVEDPLETTPTPLPFPTPSSDGDRGYIAIEVPRSVRRPHLAKLGKLHRYYLRAGEEFLKMPHGVLRDMFSRQAEPQPELRLRLVSEGVSGGPEGMRRSFYVELILANNGFGALHDPFIRVKMDPPYKGEYLSSEISIDQPDFMRHVGGSRTEGFQITGLPGTVLHPKRAASIVRLRWGTIAAPGEFTSDADRDFPATTIRGILAGSNFAARAFSHELGDESIPRGPDRSAPGNVGWWEAAWRSSDYSMDLTAGHGDAIF